jgi:MFS family permease
VAENLTEKDGKWFDENGVRVWKAGTLVYRKKELIRLFSWLYIGQFTFWMEHIAIPTLFPLLMAKKGFSAVQIGSLWSIFPLGALVIFPILGTLSDRTRTRFGRRRPFSFCMIPFWFLGLMILPFTECYWAAFAAMVLVGVAGAGSNVLNGFYNDVVPAELMGRFVAGMRMLGSIGALIVQLFALRLFDSAPIAVFITLACIGSAGELLMVWMVKEGTYPPPPPKASVLKAVGGFLKEGFANRYIIFLWLTMGVTALGGPVMATYFNLFFTDAKTGLGLSSTQLGYILAVGTAIGLCLILPAGWIIDRVGPKKIWGWSGVLVGLFQIMMFFFARNVISVSILYAFYAAINTMMTATLLPMMYSFIPKDKFGQLNGANQILVRALQIIGANGCGLLIAAVGQQYRFAFIFGGIAYMLTPIFLILMLKQPYPYGDLKTSMHPDGRSAQKAKK